MNEKALLPGLDCRRFTLRAGGATLQAMALELAGTEALPRLVFLHEALGSIAQWRDFPARLCLASGLSGLVYERRGFGGSDPLELPRPDNYLAREAEEVLPEVLAACGIARPILVGHSDGGSIALLHAAAFPEAVSACITEAAHVLVEPITLAGIREAAKAWEQGPLRQGLARHHGAKAESLYRGWSETWLRPSFAEWNMIDRLERIRCPLLVIQGRDDQYGTALQVELIVGRSAGAAEALLIEACGHVPHREQAEVTLEAMRRFIAGLTSGPCS